MPQELIRKLNIVFILLIAFDCSCSRAEVNVSDCFFPDTIHDSLAYSEINTSNKWGAELEFDDDQKILVLSNMKTGEVQKFKIQNDALFYRSSTNNTYSLVITRCALNPSPSASNCIQPGMLDSFIIVDSLNEYNVWDDSIYKFEGATCE